MSLFILYIQRGHSPGKARHDTACIALPLPWLALPCCDVFGRPTRFACQVPLPTDLYTFLDKPGILVGRQGGSASKPGRSTCSPSLPVRPGPRTDHPKTQKRQKTQKTQKTQTGIHKTIVFVRFEWFLSYRNTAFHYKTKRFLCFSLFFPKKHKLETIQTIVFVRFDWFPICVFLNKTLKNTKNV